MAKKFRGRCRQKLVLAFSRRVSVASTRSRLSQVRNKKKDDRRRKIQGRGMWEGARGEAKKYGEKKSRIGEAKNRKEERHGGPRNSLGSLPSGLVLARSCPFTTFSFFRAFSFFFLSYCRFKNSFEQGTAAAMFFLERVYTYRLVCVQATFACSDRKR